MSVIYWMSNNVMRLNVSKTQLIVVGNASNFALVGQVSIELDGVVILSTDSIKSLGLIIYSKLSWTQHINKVSRSYHLMAQSLYPLKPLLSSVNFLKFFHACVVSLLKCMVVIFGSVSKRSFRIIERGIRRSARIIRHRTVPFFNSVVIFNSDRASHCNNAISKIKQYLIMFSLGSLLCYTVISICLSLCPVHYIT
jgi:hypothetical protein